MLLVNRPSHLTEEASFFLGVLCHTHMRLDVSLLTRLGSSLNPGLEAMLQEGYAEAVKLSDEPRCQS